MGGGSFTATASFGRPDKSLVEEIGIVEMPPPNERRRMSAPLPHGAGAGNAHWPEQQSFATQAAGDQAILAVNAARVVAGRGQCPQMVFVRA